MDTLAKSYAEIRWDKIVAAAKLIAIPLSILLPAWGVKGLFGAGSAAIVPALNGHPVRVAILNTLLGATVNVALPAWTADTKEEKEALPRALLVSTVGSAFGIALSKMQSLAITGQLPKHMQTRLDSMLSSIPDKRDFLTMPRILTQEIYRIVTNLFPAKRPKTTSLAINPAAEHPLPTKAPNNDDTSIVAFPFDIQAICDALKERADALALAMCSLQANQASKDWLSSWKNEIENILDASFKHDNRSPIANILPDIEPLRELIHYLKVYLVAQKESLYNIEKPS